MPDLGDITTTIRLHPLRGVEVDGERVPWSEWGRYLKERPVFTLDPLFHAGAYYVQEASSQFVGHLLRNVHPKRLLDMCAAPGGKTTIYSSLVGGDGLVVANEPVRSRASVLADNVRKWGMGNVVVTMNDPRQIAACGEFYDVVAVDAPCSGEGMWRKDAQAREQWSEELVEMCAVRQRDILSEAWRCLKPGGVLLYSTCTFNRTENEDVLAWFVGENGDVESCGDVACPDEWGIERGEVGPFRTFRFHHERLRGEGFFVAMAAKNPSVKRNFSRVVKTQKSVFTTATQHEAAELSRWVTEPGRMVFAKIGDTCYGYRKDMYDDVNRLSAHLNVIASGVEMGQIFKGVLRPEWSLSMFYGLNRAAVPNMELGRDEALNYLRKSPLDASRFTEGMNLVLYEGLPLGFAKRVGNRVNNMYPNSLRIVHL